MAYITVSNTFTNSTTAEASEVNTNFSDIINGTSDGTKDFSIAALTLSSTFTSNGNSIIGSASGDDLTINASLASSIPIKTTATYDIGSSTLGLRAVYFGNSTFTTKLQAGTLSASNTLTFPTETGTLMTDLNSISVRALRTTAQAISTGGGNTTVVFNSEDFDTHSAFSTSTGIFTAPVTGIYAFACYISFVSGAGWAAGEIAQLRVVANGTVVAQDAEYAVATHSQPVFLKACGICSLSASQTLYADCFQNSGGTVDIDDVQTGSMQFSIYRVR